MIDKFKSFFTKNSNGIVFDRFEQELHHRPVIIFTSNIYKSKCYYLKIRSAKNDFSDTLKQPLKGELLINKSNKGLLNKDSYIDTTQVFMIDENLLLQNVDKKDVLFLNAQTFKKADVLKILQELYANLSKNPPEITFSEVSYKNNNFVSQVLYSSKLLLELELQGIQNPQYSNLIKDILDNRNNNVNNLQELKNLKLLTREEIYLQSYEKEI